MSKMVAKAFETQRTAEFSDGNSKGCENRRAFEFRIHEQERASYDAHYRELYSSGYCEGV